MISKFFVVGYMHSGTSLLQKSIGAHSRIYTPRGEIKFFEYLPVIRREHPDLRTPQQRADYIDYLLKIITRGVPFTVSRGKKFDRREAEEDLRALGADILKRTTAASDHTDIFLQALQTIAAQKGKSAFLEKSPNNIFYAEEILQYLPDARFIAIIRDPRDVISSKKKRKQTTNESRYRKAKLKYKKLEKKYSPLVDALSWRSTANAMLKFQEAHPENIFIIKYEDLVVEPEARLRQICEFLNAPFETEMLEINFRNAADTQATSSKGISADSVGKYKTVLNKLETAFIQRILNKEFKNFAFGKARISSFDALFSYTYYLKGGWDLVDRVIARFRLLGRRNFPAFVKTVLRKARA